MDMKLPAYPTLPALLGSLILFGVVSVAPAAADTSKPSAAVSQMATIMYRLKHFPSPQGKQSLREIIDAPASSRNERTLAQAMFNLQHHAREDDKLHLQQIMDDAGASSQERTLAGIIYHLDHRPSDADRERLKAMMD